MDISNTPDPPDFSWQTEAEEAAAAAQPLAGLVPMSPHPDCDGVPRRGGFWGPAGVHDPFELGTQTRSESTGDSGEGNRGDSFQLLLQRKRK